MLKILTLCLIVYSSWHLGSAEAQAQRRCPNNQTFLQYGAIESCLPRCNGPPIRCTIICTEQRPCGRGAGCYCVSNSRGDFVTGPDGRCILRKDCPRSAY